MINGVDQLCMMKLDVLSEFDTIKICTAYNVNGKIYKDNIPFDIDLDIDPVYKEFKGWKTDISNIHSYYDLPEEAKNYINYIQTELKIPMTMISVGPDRTQTIIR